MKKQTHLKGFIASGFTAMLVSLTACSQTEPAKTHKAHLTAYPVSKTEEEWKKQLSPEQFAVLRLKDTERPFTGHLLENKKSGTYVCAGCQHPLFSSESKFNSGTGWPSFFDELPGNPVKEETDQTHGMVRSEILCSNCGGHLGHVFDDGPRPTGLRYCVNSLSLDFVEGKKLTVPVPSLDTIVLGGGCYWCVEAVYEELKGVKTVESGYSGGKVKNPSYEAVCSGTTGHAEVVQIVYDPAVTSYKEVLRVFFTVHDPTTLNRQGADIGTQYRSAIFYRNEQQRNTANALIKELNQSGAWPDPIVTEVTAFKTFYKAEDYHQDYYFNNKEKGYCQAVIRPKLEKFEKVFKEQLK